MRIEARLEELGLTPLRAHGTPVALAGGVSVPEPLKAPGMRLPFASVRIRGNRAYIAGHGPQAPDGSVAGTLGKVGKENVLRDDMTSRLLHQPGP